MDYKYKTFAPNSKVYMFIIAVLIVIILYFGHIFTGFFVLSLYAFLIIYNVLNERKKEKDWKKFIEEFSLNLDSATQNTLVNNPFPLSIISEDGSILWYNKKFLKIIERENILGTNIENISNKLKTEILIKKDSLKHININNKYYDIYINNVKTAEKDNRKEVVYIVYYYDITENYNLIKSLNEDKEVVMLIEVDNFDEVLKNVDEDKQPLLKARVETTINSYGSTIKAFCKKYENNKYILSFQNKYLKEEIEKKFDILDQIREINIGNTIGITLSVGVGVYGNSSQDNYDYATQALELSLGRGGDQAVVKSGSKLDFYGGKTKEVQKRTKVRARVIAHALLNIMNESSHVFIMGHTNSDIDCFGAAFGLWRASKLLSKKCNIILENENSSVKPLLNKIRDSGEYEGMIQDSNYCLNNMDENSLLILVDVNNINYVQSREVFQRFNKIVVIDHHRRSKDFVKSALLSYVEVYASSTCELVTEVFQYMFENPKLMPLEAEALFAGISVDTKNFTFKTGVRTFEAAGFLRKSGADTVEVKKLFSYDFDSYVQRIEIIKNAEIVNGIAIAKCDEKTKDQVIAAQASDELLNINGVLASFVLFKQDNDILISGRSLGEVNVQIILERLGGGGHLTMAGTKLANMSMKKAIEKLKIEINEYKQESEDK
ncbi:MAG: DHH family phosphoesterase [Clostridiaceae bacterium]